MLHLDRYNTGKQEYGQEANAVLFSRRRSGNTPLHTCAIAGHADAAVVLIKSGANIGSQNTSGQTPLMLASSKSPRGQRATGLS